MDSTTSIEFAPAIRMHHATRAKAAKLQATFAAEYPRLTLRAMEGEQIDHEIYGYEAEGFEVVIDADTDEEEAIYAGDKVPSLAEILDYCAENEIDPTKDDEDEEPRASGSVVPEAYRAKYRAESTTGRSCGDWLAEQLAADTLDGKEKLVMEDFIAILEANDVDLTGKWAQMRYGQTPGWQGRFRMNGRQVMEKLVTKRAIYRNHTGEALVPPADWLEAMRAKHAKWLAKEAKAEAAAAEAIKQAVEGSEAA